MPTVPTLTASNTTFYSQLDEQAFFEWLSRMPCVESYRGEGAHLYIVLKRAPNRADLWDLLAFFFRYKIDMRQLARVATKRNREWFCDPKMYWHASVFGDPSA